MRVPDATPGLTQIRDLICVCLGHTVVSVVNTENWDDFLFFKNSDLWAAREALWTGIPATVVRAPRTSTKDSRSPHSWASSHGSVLRWGSLSGSPHQMRQPLWKPRHPSLRAGSGDSSAVVAAGSRKGISSTGALRQRLGANSASQGGSLLKWTHSGLPLLPSFWGQVRRKGCGIKHHPDHVILVNWWFCCLQIYSETFS